MAVIPYTVTDKYSNGGLISVTWAGMAKGDTGAPFQPDYFAYSDRSVQVEGTFDSATITIEGSNEAIPSHYEALRDPASNSLAITSAVIKQILELVAWIRPNVGGSAGSTALTVTLLLKARSRT